MLSHLRFHRRGPSNPSSPNPDQSTSPWDHSPSQPQPPFAQDAASNSDSRPQSASSSLQPPTLPPITRVTSADSQPTFDLPSFDAPMNVETQPARQPPSRSPYTEQSGFMGGVALQKYRREQQLLQEKQQQSLGRQPDPSSTPANLQPAVTESQFNRPVAEVPLNQSHPALSPAGMTTRPSPSFTSPTELSSASHAQQQPSKTGRRPPGTRLTTEPSPIIVHPIEPPKGRKGLPFLKNPMSTLLMRRKTSQNAPDIAPLPLQNPEQPFNDPRIRGTRVHDFSAPRKRKPVPSPLPDQVDDEGRSDLTKTTSSDTLDPRHRNKSNASDSGQSSSFGTASQLLPGKGSVSSVQTRRSNLDRKPLPGEPPSVPPKDEAATSEDVEASLASKAGAASEETLKGTMSSTPSTRTYRSGKISQSGSVSGRDVLSSVPRHMKSTSSRFSFDMIGAAKQEKLLEERHRQRELERKTSSPEPDGNLDSRFDDFDEDGFDYDAMMDDDGFEERIPGVNADYDDEESIPGAGYDDYEEEIPMNSMDYDEDAFEDPTHSTKGSRLSREAESVKDPDDDQDNFAGFVFQRSNPVSELTTPRSAALLVTPRDAEGKVIGFATSGETPEMRSMDSPLALPERTLQIRSQDEIAGLGIQGMDVNSSPPPTSQPTGQATNAAPQAPPPKNAQDDELYFDGGLLDENEFAGQGDGSTFDESLFDLDDTDQYGRPIPGAFAAAQAARAAAQEESKRASDTTSRLSRHSEVSQSTAHTSFSGGPQLFPSAIGTKRESDVLSDSQDVQGASSTAELDRMAAYQAALAAATHRAAADGKFRRNSSPPPSELASLPAPRSFAHDDDDDDDDDDNGLASYEDDDSFGYANMDDYDLDDDAIIAEANADALASDYEGWYGSEFGFYSSPAPPQRHSRDNSNGSDKSFEYANGGFFGPSGVSRTKSGRVVSREPNLTPITERSEYSNRNSVMSLAVPPIGSGASSLASPGLAQLAMMADDDNMSLSALMRLRSRAWGGSQISLSSSREGSPRSDRGDGASSPWGDRPNLLGPHGHARKSSAFSVRSREFDSSEAGSAAGSPTLTMSLPAVTSPPPPVPPLMNPASPLSVPLQPNAQLESTFEANTKPSMGWVRSPDTMTHPNLVTSPATSRRPGIGHKHKGSADSISYIQEEESGETRWVMERRYTADTGEIEVEREILQQGRI